MTDDKNEKKPKTLRLPSSAGISKQLDSSRSSRSSFFTSKANNVTVEIKGSKNLPNTSIFSSTKLKANGSSLSEDELNSKLSLLKRAAENSKVEQNKVVESNSSDSMLGEKDESLLNNTNILSQGLEENSKNLTDLSKKESNELLSDNEPKSKEESEVTIQNKQPNFHVRKKEVVEEQKKDNSKPKKDEVKKFNKTDIYSLLDENRKFKTRSLASIQRARGKEKRKLQNQSQQDKIYREVTLPESIMVSELASRMSERTKDVVKELMNLGITGGANQIIDADVAELVVNALGHTCKRTKESDVENVLKIDEEEANLKSRAPVVTVMGHVDHGKTSLLDALKSTDIAATEAGGITQHIGAYTVKLKGGSITFIDTPGHEAFTAMRVHGAKVTDIVVLVVAADDGIKTQTIEAINHAKAANVPIIVAINKIDKPNANVEKVKNELLSHELISEDLGGDTIVVPVSALSKKNLDKLEEAILLVADMLELKANYDTAASGAIIEARVDTNRGVVATALIQRGKLKIGDLIVAGASSGKVKTITNDKGEKVKSAYPSEPVEVLGLNQVPNAGDIISVVSNEKQVKDIIGYRIRKVQERKHAISRENIEELFKQASEGNVSKDLNFILKTDVSGSLEAIVSSLLKIKHEEIKIKIVHKAVGPITKSDINLAQASNAVILGFNVRADSTAEQQAEKDKLDIRYYSIIYDLIDDVKKLMSGMLDPTLREEYLGAAEVREIFNITKVGKIAGCYITKGTIKRGSMVRLLRDSVVIFEGKLKTLKRFKDDVKEAREGFECGIELDNYSDIRIKDVIEAYEVKEDKREII